MTGDVLRRVANDLEQQLQSFDPECVSGADARELVLLFDRIVRLGTSGRTLSAARVESCNAFVSGGFKNGAQWLASSTGLSLGEAVSSLETGRAVESLSSVRSAMLSGSLSFDQARAVSRGACVDPSLETDLLSSVSASSVTDLNKRVASIERASLPEEHDRLRRRQYFRRWAGKDGLRYGQYAMLAENEAVFVAAQEAFTSSVFTHARRAGRRDPHGVYEVEGLVEMAKAKSGSGTGTGSKTVNVRVDYDALQRGFVEGSEVCEIEGVGSVPVASAKAMLDDAFLKVILTKGGNVVRAFHGGATTPAWVRSTVTERDTTCVVPGCDVVRNLEIHHYCIDKANNGPPHPENLCRLCSWHHYLVTHKGFRIDGEAGNWRWLTPEDEQPPVDVTRFETRRAVLEARRLTPTGTDPPSLFSS